MCNGGATFLLANEEGTPGHLVRLKVENGLFEKDRLQNLLSYWPKISSTKLYYVTANHEFVPDELFIPSNAHGYLSAPTKGFHVNSKVIWDEFFHDVFAVKQELYDKVNALLPNVEWQSVHYLLHEIARKVVKLETGVLSFSYMNHIFVAGFKKGKLILANTYEVSGKKDLAYFLLLPFEYFNYSIGERHLYLCGYVSSMDDALQLITPNVSSTNFLNPNDYMDLSNSFKETIGHEEALPFFSLLCE